VTTVLIAFVVFGGIGFVVALVVALGLARSSRIALAIAAVGPAAVAAYLLYRRLNPPDYPLHHEAEYFGVKLDPVMWLTLAFNLAGWLIGTAVGFVTRRARRRVRPDAVRSS
jgi:hypothetical protein